MRILLIANGLHSKNLNALSKYNLEIKSIYHTNLDNINLNEFDVIYSPALPIDVSRYPSSKFIFGPHFSVFPENTQIRTIQGNQNVV